MSETGLNPEPIGKLPLPTEPLCHAVSALWTADGSLVLADEFAHQLHWLAPDRTRLTQSVGERGAEPGQFWYPRGLALANGRLWVCDSWNHRLAARCNTTGEWQTFGGMGTGPDQWNEPHDLIALADGGLLVLDRSNNRLTRVDPESGARSPLGEADHELPTHLLQEPDGTLLVVDRHGSRLRRLDPSSGVVRETTAVELGPQLHSLRRVGSFLVSSSEFVPRVVLHTPFGIPLLAWQGDGVEGIVLLDDPEQENGLLLLQGQALLRLTLPTLPLGALVAARLEQLAERWLPALLQELGASLDESVRARLLERIAAASTLDAAARWQVEQTCLELGFSPPAADPSAETPDLDALGGMLDRLEQHSQALLQSVHALCQQALEGPADLEAVGQLQQVLIPRNRLQTEIIDWLTGPSSPLEQARHLARVAQESDPRLAALRSQVEQARTRIAAHLDWQLAFIERCWAGLPDWPSLSDGPPYHYTAHYPNFLQLVDLAGLPSQLTRTLGELLTLTASSQTPALHPQWWLLGRPMQDLLRGGPAGTNWRQLESIGEPIDIPLVGAPVSCVEFEDSYLIADGQHHLLLRMDRQGGNPQHWLAKDLGLSSVGRLTRLGDDVLVCDPLAGKIFLLDLTEMIFREQDWPAVSVPRSIDVGPDGSLLVIGWDADVLHLDASGALIARLDKAQLGAPDFGLFTPEGEILLVDARNHSLLAWDGQSSQASEICRNQSWQPNGLHLLGDDCLLMLDQRHLLQLTRAGELIARWKISGTLIRVWGDADALHVLSAGPNQLTTYRLAPVR